MQAADETVFRERQRFRPWWMGLMLLPLAPLLHSAFIDIQFYRSAANDPSAHASGGLIVLPVWIATCLVLYFGFFLDILIDNQGVSVKYMPFSGDYELFAWHEIHQIYLRQYRPIGEYGGWGYRKRWPRDLTQKISWGYHCNIAYTVQGDQGLQLILSDGSKVLIGTQDAAGMERVLQVLGKI